MDAVKKEKERQNGGCSSPSEPHFALCLTSKGYLSMLELSFSPLLLAQSSRSRPATHYLDAHRHHDGHQKRNKRFVLVTSTPFETAGSSEARTVTLHAFRSSS